MSGFRRALPARARRSRPPKGLVLLWNACCITVLQGCLYLGPPWEVPVNERPDIIKPVDNLNTLVLVADEEVLTVMARDPDADPVYFVWSVPHGAAYTEEAPFVTDEGIHVSVLKVARDSRLQGAEIECLVHDNNVFPARQLIWHVEVP